MRHMGNSQLETLMDFIIRSSSEETNEAVNLPGAAVEASFRISARPLVSAAEANPDPEAAELPRSYGRDTLYLMARDPHSLFAYWDIDWSDAFGETTPLERKVHLRILRADGSEEQRIEVEPMAGGHIVETAAPNADYTAELGYYSSAGEWKSVAISAAVNTPPALPADGITADLTTIPFHLSFQRMLDVLRVPNQENGSLTAMLATLRERAESDTLGGFSVAQHDLIETIDQVVAHTPPPAERVATTVLWTEEQLEQMLGFRSSSRLAGSSKL